MLQIKELRKQNNITMKRLGEIVGVSESCISQYENGKRQPDNDMLKRLADFFNVSVDQLLGRKETVSLDEQLSKEEFALFGEVRDLTTEEKKRVLDFIKFTKSQREE